MKLKVTTKEILDRIEEIKQDDMFGFERGDLISFLPYKEAKEFLNDDVTKEQWEGENINKTPKEEIADYMEFAWGKANGCRGLSAGRSISHMKAWLFLDGKKDLADKMDDMYEYYGKPCLIAICEEYDIDWKKYDDGIRTNTDY